PSDRAPARRARAVRRGPRRRVRGRPGARQGGRDQRVARAARPQRRPRTAGDGARRLGCDLDRHPLAREPRQPRAGPRHRPARVDRTRPGRQRAAARRPPRLGAPGEAGGTRVSDKPEIRERVWALLTARRVARFPLPLDERIPNFTGAARLGEPVEPESLGAIDLVVTGSVAVSPEGARVGKGGGYSDLEFALARELGALGEDTPVATTVHELQILGEPLPMTDHDVPLDLIATP